MTTASQYPILHATRAAIRAGIMADLCRDAARDMHIDVCELTSADEVLTPDDLEPFEAMHRAADEAVKAYRAALWRALRIVAPDFQPYDGSTFGSYTHDAARLEELIDTAVAYGMHRRRPDAHGRPQTKHDREQDRYEYRHNC